MKKGAAVPGIDLTRMECKEQTQVRYNRNFLRIDLTRMECKAF